MQVPASEVTAIFERLGAPTAFVLIAMWIFYKVLWPWWSKRQEQQDTARAAESARVAAVLDDQIKWSRMREDTTLKELITTLQAIGKTGERTDDNVKLALEEIRRKNERNPQ